MTNQELRTTITISNKLQKGDEREVTDAILRLLDEHQLMAEALFVIAINALHIPGNPTSHCDYAREILSQCKGVVIT